MGASVEHVLLVRNTDSGSGEAERIDALIRGRGAEPRLKSIDELATDPDAGGASRVIVAGGDGSLAPAALAAARAAVPFAVIPVGTANDFARGLGLPGDPDRACELAVAGERTRSIDIGLLGGRPFLNAASVGLPPRAAREASGLKRALGPLAYVVGALRAGLGAEPVSCRLLIDGSERFDGRAWQLTIASTGSFGAGSSVEADPSDGELDVVVISAGPRARLIRHAYGLRAGRVEPQAGVDRWRGVPVEIEVPIEAELNIDGEVVPVADLELTDGRLVARVSADQVGVVVG